MRSQKIRAYALSLCLHFISLPGFSQLDERLKTKLFNLLYILVPLVFVVSVFMFLEWKRKKDLHSGEKFDVSDKK